MMRPYYEQAPAQSSYSSFGIGSKLTTAVRRIIYACAGVFLLQIVLRSQEGDIYFRFRNLFAFTPMSRLGTTHVWQYVTYMFLHSDFWHIALNLFFFWMIGGIVEERIGTKRFLWLFFLAGIAGAVAQGAIFPGSSTIGASAGIMGVAAAAAALYPDMKILFFFVLPMKMKYFLVVLVLLEVWGASASGNGGNVAYFAHLTGLAVGYLFVRHGMKMTGTLNILYYRLRGRVRGFVGQAKTVHIDDDEKYRQEVDRLLDKIFREGTQSLTAQESEFLKKQSDKYKKQV
jgi:membrane associated rhomboid family serine protease